MKKTILVAFSLVLLVGIITLSLDKNTTNAETKKALTASSTSKNDIREIAYNKLSAEYKQKIKGTWKDSKLSKIVLKEGMGNIKDSSFIGKEVYLIDFPTSTKSLPNNLIVYLDENSNTILGYGYVE